MTVARTLPLPEPVPILSSGEIGIEVVETIRVIESAVRRCGKSAATLTAEDLDTAKTNLHFILASLSNKGVNLWAVDRQLVPVVRGQSTYTLPVGTEKILNIMYRTNEPLPTVNKILTGLTYAYLTLGDLTEFNMLGFKLPSEYTGRLIVEYTDESGDWKEHRNFGEVDLDAGWHWYSFDPGLIARGVRIRDLGDKMFTLSDFTISNSSTDRDITRLNRDSYTALPNKMRKGRPNCYFFDKQIEAELTLWPIPEDASAQVIIWRQRRIHDVGSLAQKLELPERWFEAITWALAKNLAFELVGVPPDRIALCTSEAAATLRDAELGESDQAPLFIRPNIGGYTA